MVKSNKIIFLNFFFLAHNYYCDSSFYNKNNQAINIEEKNHINIKVTKYLKFGNSFIYLFIGLRS
jgi:hypothetical protein